jgi:hypothetical protein
MRLRIRRLGSVRIEEFTKRDYIAFHARVHRTLPTFVWEALHADRGLISVLRQAFRLRRVLLRLTSPGG